MTLLGSLKTLQLYSEFEMGLSRHGLGARVARGTRRRRGASSILRCARRMAKRRIFCVDQQIRERRPLRRGVDLFRGGGGVVLA